MKVSLFIPCLVESLQPHIGEAFSRILAHLGLDLSYPKHQTCCGQLLYKSGHWKRARKLAKHFLEVFQTAETIIAPSGSCVSMVRNYYPMLFQDEPAFYDRAIEIGRRVFELTEFLVRILGVHDLGASWKGRAIYHDSCQVSRALGIIQEPRALLSHVRGLHLLDMEHPDLCCGFGGIFSLQFPVVSEAILAEKVAHILATQADFVISAEISCLMNIAGYLKKHGHHVRALHIAEILVNQ